MVECKDCLFLMTEYVASEAGGGCPMCGASRDRLIFGVQLRQGPRGKERVYPTDDGEDIAKAGGKMPPAGLASTEGLAPSSTESARTPGEHMKRDGQ